MSVGEFCNRDVVIVAKEQNVVEAAKLMRQYHVGDVVVVMDKDDKKIPVGILTDRDIVIELVAEQVDPQSLTVGDVMSDQLLIVSERDELLDTIEQMRSKGVRRVPIVGEQGELVGILTLDDVLDVLAEAFNGLVLLTGRELRRERQTRGQ
jgi:CBS domain-containing protein